MVSGRRADKRGTFDICADMLKVLEVQHECNRALLASMSNLDGRALAKYLGLLLKYDLVMQPQSGARPKIRISEKGRRYLNQYLKLTGLLD
jgi:predicted transcriptional regulator